MPWRILLMMLLLSVPSISYAGDALEDCIQSNMRATGKTRGEVYRACNAELSEIRSTEKCVQILRDTPKNLNPITYEEKIAEAYRIKCLGEQLGKTPQEIQEELRFRGLDNIRREKRG